MLHVQKSNRYGFMVCKFNPHLTITMEFKRSVRTTDFVRRSGALLSGASWVPTHINVDRLTDVRSDFGPTEPDGCLVTITAKIILPGLHRP